MKSRFWNTWTRDEPKVRSPAIVLKDRDDNKNVRVVAEESRKNNRKNGTRLIDRFSPTRNGKSRTNGHDEYDNNHDNDDDDNDHDHDNDGDDDVEDDENPGYRAKDHSTWSREKLRFNDDLRNRNSKNGLTGMATAAAASVSTTSDNHDRCVDARLTNGKSRMTTSNGFVKQVKRTDELSLAVSERECRGVNFGIDYDNGVDDDDNDDDDDDDEDEDEDEDDDDDDYDDDVDDDDNGDNNKRNSYDSEVNGNNCEPIKFVRRFDEFEYSKREPMKVSKLSSRNKLQNKRNNYKEHNRNNGDSMPRRSTSARQEFIYVDKRSQKHDCGGDEYETRSPDRNVEYGRKETNGRHVSLTNGSRRSRSDDHHWQRKRSDHKSSLEDVDHMTMQTTTATTKYDRNRRESRRNGDHLVRTSRENTLNDHHHPHHNRHHHHNHPSHHDNNGLLRRRSSSDYRRADRNHDDKRSNKPRDSSLKRHSSRDRQMFRKISFNLKSKEKKKESKDNTKCEKELMRSNLRRDDRHSRPLTPPTATTTATAAAATTTNTTEVNDLEVVDDNNETLATAARQRKLLLSKDYRKDCTRHEKKFNHNSRDSSDLSWIDKALSWYSSEESPEREKTKKYLIENDDSDTNFSTIERNGTTVIRIRTTSQSPVRSGDGQFQCRCIRDVSMERRNKFEEEDAGDECDDDEEEENNENNMSNDGDMDGDFEFSNHGRHLTESLQSRDYNDLSIQITDLEDGQPCLHCGETCPGFSPHTWRKNCTSCKCPKEAHDVCHEEWVSVRARLGLKGDEPNNYIGFEPRERGLAWAPPGLPPNKVEEYFTMLPEISVPRLGTPGERHRDRQLATQLPKQDLARAYCRHLDSQHAASADDFMAARNEIALDIGSVQEVLERGHQCGVCHELLKYGSIAVMASKLGVLYHPACFQCAHCRELLVDLAYCVHDDVLYCERHYAERLKPRCAACDELIFSGEYTKAMNKDWHSGHFCCWQCDESLTGQRYVLRDEHPYCIKCYESVFANGCEECNKIIGIDSKDLSYKDKHWHEACFLCNKCRVSLVDKQFGSKVDKIYCGNCYDAQFASRCDGCGEIFRAGTKKMEYKTRQWHEKCFCCVVCKNPIGTKSFIPREQEIYCAGCYEDKFATRCVKCNKIITSGGVTYKNEPWHRDCFTCSHCNNSLAGQRFTSRDDKPYCAECFGELFAKRCTACTKPITGIGGTRFISFEDRHWHNDCFICAGCTTSLVGRGFITDGDDIICPECAKQKLSE